jgi:hypothetical protein
MLSTVNNEQFYTAQAAYYLRSFAMTKRYKAHDITAYSVPANSPYRDEVESFIALIFKQQHGAIITEFMPELVALRDSEGKLMAAFGMRKAANEPLFLEQYIDEPIEVLMADKLGQYIPRDAITCIGNLAVANPRNAGVLITHIIQHSLDIGIEWCVATAHHSLQNGLVKAGRNVYPLHFADKLSLPLEEQDKWGSYYDKMPQVVAIQGVKDY